MGLETVTHISDLNASNPAASDAKSQGDDHIRNIKTALKTDFPNINGVVSASDEELSYVTGATSPIQTQLNAKAPTASPTFTGTPAAPTAAAGTNTTQLATTAHVFAERTNAATLTNKTLTSPVINSPTGIVKADIGLSNVDNTSDAAKPISTLTQAALDLKAPLASPTFTGTPAAPTATTGTNTTQVATCEFVNNTALAASLPNQTGNAGKYLVTDGTNAAWSAVVSGLYYVAKSGAYTVLITDDKYLIDCTGTFTLSFSAVATLGNGFQCLVRNSGTGTITLDPNGAETIDGIASGALKPGMAVWVQCNGTNLKTVRLGPWANTEVLTSGTSWTCPIGVTRIRVRVVGGGGGGAGSSGANRGTGGGAGAYCERFETVVPGTSYSYIIGAAGSGSAGAGDGTAGGNSTWTNSSTITAAGGPGGSITNPYVAGGTATCSGGVARDGESGIGIQVNGTVGHGVGGSTPFGAGGHIYSTTTVQAASGYGAGGPGVYSTSSASGGSGTAGVIVLEY